MPSQLGSISNDLKRTRPARSRLWMLVCGVASSSFHAASTSSLDVFCMWRSSNASRVFNLDDGNPRFVTSTFSSIAMASMPEQVQTLLM
mmetsp:Transcript_141069/g.450502  ORF Transcript_141069/g.450502 Transcript_141069/m.450502 type:complete len:89 (-) Transcript_141069:963-1229(-)